MVVVEFAALAAAQRPSPADAQAWLRAGIAQTVLLQKPDVDIPLPAAAGGTPQQIVAEIFDVIRTDGPS